MQPDPFLVPIAGRPAASDQTAVNTAAHPPYAFIALGTLSGAVLTIALIGATVARGPQFALDRAIMLSLRTPISVAVPADRGWLTQSMIDVTALGSETVLTIVVVLATGLLIASRHLLTAALIVSGTVSGSTAVQIAKGLVARERPALVEHFVEATSTSFPSGHAANGAIVYLTIILTVLQIVTSRAARWYLVSATITLVLLIGASRVYLGVHWPSDVLAGWGAGTLWALSWWALGCWFHLRTGRQLTPLRRQLHQNVQAASDHGSVQTRCRERGAADQARSGRAGHC
jgi:undecaprenyl-diphosphatase